MLEAHAIIKKVRHYSKISSRGNESNYQLKSLPHNIFHFSSHSNDEVDTMKNNVSLSGILAGKQ